MRLYDNVRKCVAYLGIPKHGNQRDLKLIVGTGFMVDHEGGNYLVTAAHVAQLLEDKSVGVRLNDKDDFARVIEFEAIKWWYHVDPTVDVAVMEFPYPSWHKPEPLIPKWFVTAFKRETKNIGAGDMCHIIGCFKFLPGTKRNMPTVHTGNISMMADDEPIPVKHWRTEGYLVEAQTLDTLSGSPVMVRRSIPAKVLVSDIDKNPLGVWWHGSLWLLGLWHGAWYGKPKERKRVPGGGEVKIPAGMGIVVPAIKIIEVLERPELKANRARKATLAALQTPDLDSADLASASGDDILRAALNTPPRRRPKRRAKASRSTVSSK